MNLPLPPSSSPPGEEEHFLTTTCKSCGAVLSFDLRILEAYLAHFLPALRCPLCRVLLPTASYSRSAG